MSTEHEALVQDAMTRYGLSKEKAEISAERRKVYGDPYVNHQGIAMGWAGILQPWALRIARMDHLPPHVVALLMASLKTNRMRMVFHKDNYDDADVYFSFAKAWQEEWQKAGSEMGIVIGPRPSESHVLSVTWVLPPVETNATTVRKTVRLQTVLFGVVAQELRLSKFGDDLLVELTDEDRPVPVALSHRGKNYKVVPV